VVRAKDGNVTQEQVAQELAIGKHVVSYAAGALTMVGILTTADSATLITSFDHIVNGVKEIAIGAGPLVALGMGLWARYNTSTKAQIASVAASPQVSTVIVKDPVLANSIPAQNVKTVTPAAQAAVNASPQ
jgi:hypothetical protein